VLKENLTRLAPAVRRAMQEVEDRIEHEKLQDQLIESQKMEMVGQVTGGVAHDFNNILAVIIGCTDLMMPGLAPDSPIRKYAEEVRQAANRATGLTRQLLIYSRKQAVQSGVLNLNDVVKDMDSMLQRLINKNIEMTIVLDNEIGRVKADSGYVGQVLMNLVINARDAMPNGGEIVIATHNVILDESYTSTRRDVSSGDYVMLSISDTGTGMTEEVKLHLFDPFFTTKPIGKGTGLGLATCLTIIRQSHGHIDVQSELGTGTTFKIYFPRVEQPMEMFVKPVSSKELARGTETLLIVEDEPAVRHLACMMLENQGYHVLQANNGQEGFRMMHIHKNGPIDLVITDVVMPKISGKVMAEWLKAAYPNLKILFTSGYPNDVIAQYGMLEPDSAFLQKPFTLAELSDKVRELLDTPLKPVQKRA
jgi:nitrogen-specific signal transduction histidine kinase